MADERRGGGFLAGLLLGGVAGFVVGAYLTSEAGRSGLGQLRERTADLAGDPSQLREKATSALDAAREAVGDAVQEGMAAARERRQELGQPTPPHGLGDGEARETPEVREASEKPEASEEGRPNG